MKKYVKSLIAILLVLISTGCFKRDTMEDINIITTVYPLEFVLNRLYSEHSIINSIYPDGISINEYELTEKQLDEFSNKDLFVYNGFTKDRDLALTLLNKNKDLLITDANFGMDVEYGIEEFWLNPSNLLMISQNIKNSLTELITSKYLIEEINENYNELKIELSELDADINTAVEQSKNKVIITGSKSLQFLTKYGIDVILVNNDEENEPNYDKAINEINNNNIIYAFMLEDDDESTLYKQLVKEKKLTTLTFDKLDNITDDQRNNKENYISLMKKNIEVLRKGLDN